MFRIDNPTAAGTLPAPTPVGTPGYFTDGSPVGGVPATIVSAEFLNMIQEELANAVLAFGLTLSKSSFNQLATALRLSRQQRFTSSGSFTVPAGVTTIFVSGCAGGAGGGGAGGPISTAGTAGGGGGGGAGQSIIRVPFSVTPGQVIPITIPAGGAGGAGGPPGNNGSDGGSGGNTVIGTLITLSQASGVGTHGNYNPSTPAGGSGGGGFPQGSFGSDGGQGATGGAGASGPFGGGGGSARGGQTSSGAGIPAAGFGAGGGGGSSAYATASATGGAGGAGAPGFAMIEW